MTDAALGIDLGGTKIAAALVSEAGEVLAHRSLPTDAGQGQAAVIGRMVRLSNELIQEAGQRSLNLLGLGVGSPGLVDAINGTVFNAVNLGWQEVHLADELTDRLQWSLPVWVQKDGNALAIGEYVFGAARDCPDFLYLSLGTGLGGGLFAAGQLISGANWNATEVGHISLDPLNGRMCACGLRGCAETVLSGQGLVALYNKRTAAAGKPAPEAISPVEIIRAARQQEGLALQVMAEMGRTLGTMIAFCAAFTNPSLVVIGGGLGQAVFDLLLPHARAELEKRVLTASHAGLRIVPSQQESSALGPASLVWYSKPRR